ncbi:MAG: aspartate--tRNA ligase [bacterium]
MQLKRNHFCGNLSKKNEGETIILAGWVRKKRDHGGLIFVDLGDKSGVVQVVFNPKVNEESHLQAGSLGEGWVIAVEGKVRPRPLESVNPELRTGEIEVIVENLEILNISESLPFPVQNKIEASEETRLKYRYLDLRRPVMQRNLCLRYEVTKQVRSFLDKKGFVEIETPFLTRSTPEGARDYLVPSRVNPGEFYALPQSPQLFKQLLMVAGFDRYFQIVRCFRDEDLRADRQPEHTQIDIEASFIEEDDIYQLVELMLVHVFKKTVRMPLKIPFPRLDYEEAMDRFGTDKPDTRFGLELKNISSLASQSKFEVFQRCLAQGGEVKGLRLPGGACLSRKELEDLSQLIEPYGAKGLSWILLTSEKIKSPLSKFFPKPILLRIIEHMEGEKGDALLFVADGKEVVADSLAQLRLELGKRFNLIPENVYQPVWIVDFPLFEQDREGRLSARHHPFTSPKEEDLLLLETNPEKVKARSYDIVLNGEEIGGGSMRIHRRKIQERVLEILGIDSLQARERFGFLLEALSLGAPPHGGIALGLDRLVMILAGAQSIREVIPFPKTQKAISLLTQAPSPVDEEQLKELHIKVRKKSFPPP